MSKEVIFLVLFVFVLGGCASNSKKQVIKSQPAVSEKLQEASQQELSYQNYDYSDTRLSENYEKSLKKTHTGQGIQLSPKQIQRALKNAGCYDGSIDGNIGPKTKAAIIKFQRAKGLKTDGIIGKKTSAELNKYLSK